MQKPEPKLPEQRGEHDGQPWIRTLGGPPVSAATYSLAELYHENSKYQRALMVNEPLDAAAAFRIPVRSGEPAVDLPTPSADLACSLGHALRHRRSVRQFRYELMPLATLSDLLFYAAGTTDVLRMEFGDRVFTQPIRTYPAAGSLYAVDLLVIARNVEGVASGAYYYDAPRHRLLTVPADPEIAWTLLDTTSLHPSLVDLYNTQVILVPVAVFRRHGAKYRRRAYRFTLQESGHMMQNALLAATALGLGAVTLGAYYDDECNRLLGLDGVEESVLYLVPIGRQEELEGVPG